MMHVTSSSGIFTKGDQCSLHAAAAVAASMQGVVGLFGL
jgi:hypothetical protein